MARYLVIEVADNKAAESLVESLHRQTKAGSLARLVGIFVKPGKTCDCVNWRTANYRENKAKHGFSGGVEKGDKFGWWVCTNCNKPRRGSHQLNNQLLASETFSELKPLDPEWEFVVDSMTIGSIHQDNINRPKKLKKRKKPNA